MHPTLVLVEEAVAAFYRERFRAPHSVQLGIHTWHELQVELSMWARFVPVTKRPDDTLFCAYCGGTLPRRKPGARCDQCGAPWTTREGARGDEREHSAQAQLGFTSCRVHTFCGAVDVNLDIALADDAIVVL